LVSKNSAPVASLARGSACARHPRLRLPARPPRNDSCRAISSPPSTRENLAAPSGLSRFPHRAPRHHCAPRRRLDVVPASASLSSRRTRCPSLGRPPAAVSPLYHNARPPANALSSPTKPPSAPSRAAAVLPPAHPLSPPTVRCRRRSTSPSGRRSTRVPPCRGSRADQHHRAPQIWAGETAAPATASRPRCR
jgi:hypothetical protein